MTWSVLVNSKSDDGGDILDEATFNATIDKNNATKGKWQEDYDEFCNNLGVTACPFMKAYPIVSNEKKDETKPKGEGEGEGEGEEKKEEVFKITNATLDSSSFRAALLACAVTGSVIVEINISMCQVTPAQIMDLTKALEVLGPKCRSLKLNNLHNIQNTEDYHDCITKLISVMGLQYLSLQGNGFDDNFLSNTIGPALETNYTLKSLNLSDNGITDKGTNTLFHALRHRTNLTHISLRSNSLTGSFLSDTLAKLVTGRMEVTAADEAYIKGISKEFGNKNKTIKDLNKKRKGAGQQEYMEIPEQASLMKTAKDSSSVLLWWNSRCI
jgi:hypothetical protein